MKKSLSTIASLFLCLFFVVIMLFVALGVIDILSYDNGAAALLFSVINFVVLTGVVGFGRNMLKASGVGMYLPLCAASIVYTVIAQIVTLTLFNVLTATWFVLVELLVIFVFFCAAIPMIVIGINRKKNEDEKHDIKYHNL